MDVDALDEGDERHGNGGDLRKKMIASTLKEN